MHHAAQEHAVEAPIRKRQLLDVAFEEFDIGMLAPSDRDQFGADVEAHAVVARARQQGGEGAGPAAEIGYARAGWQSRQSHERVDQALARLWREHVVIVRGGMTIEERDLFLFVLCFVLHRICPVLEWETGSMTVPSTTPAPVQ